MQPFTKVTGVVAAMDRANVDTDQIIPKQFLKRIERSGFGQYLFFDWRFNEDGTPVQLTKRKKAALVADKVIVQGVLGNTVGRVGRVAGRLLLGRIPDTAKEGSFQEEKSLDAAALPASKFMDVINEDD